MIDEPTTSRYTVVVTMVATVVLDAQTDLGMDAIRKMVTDSLQYETFKGDDGVEIEPAIIEEVEIDSEEVL